jgi:hypothetical protein
VVEAESGEAVIRSVTRVEEAAGSGLAAWGCFLEVYRRFNYFCLRRIDGVDRVQQVRIKPQIRGCPHVCCIVALHDDTPVGSGAGSKNEQAGQGQNLSHHVNPPCCWGKNTMVTWLCQLGKTLPIFRNSAMVGAWKRSIHFSLLLLWASKVPSQGNLKGWSGRL